MKCPICKKPVVAPTDSETKSAYPFCSERCQLIDLGRWLDGKYQIPTTPADDESDSESSIPPENENGPL
jgi:endogenous inhibitor of DNA gyrase (YacG/DUF329 family)